MNSQDSSQEHSAAEPELAIFHREYSSYLLRLWRADADGGLRASLQSIPSGERHMFADLESLLAFLSALSH
jgi:hypothetical protein